MTQTILIIEDNLHIRKFLATVLELESYRVVQASTLQEGRALTLREQPDLILLDLALPDGTGWEFLEMMQAQPGARRARVAILTASADQGMADRGLAAGAVAFITKPIAARELSACVRRILNADHPESIRSEP